MDGPLFTGVFVEFPLFKFKSFPFVPNVLELEELKTVFDSPFFYSGCFTRLDAKTVEDDVFIPDGFTTVVPDVVVDVLLGFFVS